MTVSVGSAVIVRGVVSCNGLGEPNIACLPEATPADALCMSALDTCSQCILLTKRFGCLPLPGCLQRLVLLTGLKPNNAGLLLGPRTLCPVQTRRTVFPGKARLPCHPCLGIGMRKPGDALLAHRAGHDLALPIDPKLRFVKASPLAGLPTRVVGDGTKERDAIRLLALDQNLQVRIALGT